jgi:hypothetical protein
MLQTKNEATSWVQIAEGLYDFLTRRGATIEYSFKDMEVMVPRDTGENAPLAKWSVNGTIQVRTWESNMNAHENAA